MSLRNKSRMPLKNLSTTANTQVCQDGISFKCSEFAGPLLQDTCHILYKNLYFSSVHLRSEIFQRTSKKRWSAELQAFQTLRWGQPEKEKQTHCGNDEYMSTFGQRVCMNTSSQAHVCSRLQNRTGCRMSGATSAQARYSATTRASRFGFVLWGAHRLFKTHVLVLGQIEHDSAVLITF